LTYGDGQVTFALSPLIRGISLARKILLADDSVTAQNMGRKILADAGYEVIAVNNGSAALKKIAELKPDLVILDVYMPGYSGLEVCQRMKESQESSRIPVLLSVGKLEPFKPEEAQRVRADGYIVKPFEASELLSALSKLEDKVVPRAEPSKPGRFARAIAAAEESSRGSENPSEASGWKSRIGFPKAKTESAEKVADEASTYNLVNRDLRTVVQTTEHKAAENITQEGQARQEAVKADVDVAAFVPAGLPQDVTAEEVAAIAAAAAQIQMAEATLTDEQRGSELPAGEIQIASQARAEAAAAESKHAPLPEVHNEFAAVPTDLQATIAQHEGVESSSVQRAAAEAVEHRNGDERPEQHLEQQPEQRRDEPVTMAATADSVSANSTRWTAVPMALEGEEASISLEQEMQKVYAAFETGDAEPAGTGLAETGVVGINSESAIQPPATEPVVSLEAEQSAPEPVAQLEAAVASEQIGTPSGVNEEVTPSPVNTPNSSVPEFAQSDKAMPVAEFLSPVSEAEVAGLAGLVGLSAESQLAAEPEEAAAQPTTVTSKPFTRIMRTPENGAPLVEQAKPEQEDVKSAAAAWSNWRQIRDTGNGEEAVAPQAESEESARAVAAGAEQIAQASESNKNPADVASIVDSVLADLRPKLMAEISRKMAEKK
jgi:CheY-like chemotaxis protein